MVDYLIHLYQKGSEPFRSLSALPDDEAVRIMRSLYRAGSVYWERFEDAAQYLAMRRQTENWLRQEFLAKGGCPRDPYPIYMVWGRTKWLETAMNPVTVATTAEIQVPLALFESLRHQLYLPRQHGIGHAGKPAGPCVLPAGLSWARLLVGRDSCDCGSARLTGRNVGCEPAESPGKLHRGAGMESPAAA